MDYSQILQMSTGRKCQAQSEIILVSDPKLVIVELQTVVCKSHLSSPRQWSQTLCFNFSIIELLNVNSRAYCYPCQLPLLALKFQLEMPQIMADDGFRNYAARRLFCAISLIYSLSFSCGYIHAYKNEAKQKSVLFSI